MQSRTKSKRRQEREANPLTPQWVPPIIDIQSQDQTFLDFNEQEKQQNANSDQMSDLDFTKIDWDPFFETLQNQILLDFFYKLGKKHIPLHLKKKGIIDHFDQWDDRSFFLQMKGHIMEQLDIVQLWVDWNIRKVQANSKLKRKMKEKAKIKQKLGQDIQELLDQIIQKNRSKTEDQIVQEFIKTRDTTPYEPLKKVELDEADKAQVQFERKKVAENLQKAQAKLKLQQVCINQLFQRFEKQFSSTKFIY